MVEMCAGGGVRRCAYAEANESPGQWYCSGGGGGRSGEYSGPFSWGEDGQGESLERGQSLQDDIERVQEVRRLMPEATIRVDANRGWSVDQAIEAAKRLGPLEYMEQPCATIEELEQVRPYVKVAADESIRKESDPLKVKGRVDYAILKCQPMGGPTNVLKVEKELGLRVTVSSALETAVGMYACLATAAAQDVQPAAGLGTGGFFYEDVAERRQIVDGAIDVTPVTPTNFPACKNEDFGIGV